MDDFSKKPVVGAIYAPFTPGISSHPQDSQNGTLYSAADGLGSFLTQVNPENFPSLLNPSSRSQSTRTDRNNTCSPTEYSARLPLLKPPGPFPIEAPKSCLFAAEWGKDRRDKLDGNLTKKVNSMWNMACEIGGRGGKGGKYLLSIQVSVKGLATDNFTIRSGMVHGVRSLGSAALDMAYVA